MRPHEPVMVGEVLSGLQVVAGGIYVDATVGGGGHAEAILRASGPNGKLLGLDRDRDAIASCESRLAPFGKRVILCHSAFRELEGEAHAARFADVDGILFDLGVSSHHLESPERGFGFQASGPLDMRMDRRTQTTAADLINRLPESELSRIIRDWGEERFHRRIAAGIVRARAEAPIATTGRLKDVILESIPKSYGRDRIHPATRTFQAIRIAVNDELGQLKAALPQALELLRPGGRFCVIAFHSLEDRIVKETFREWARGCICPPSFPVCRCGHKPAGIIMTRKPAVPSDEEVSRNPRSRSAKLRVFERSPGAKAHGGESAG